MNEIAEFLRGVIDPAQMYVLLAFAMGHIFIGVFGAMIHGDFEVVKFVEFYKKVGLFVTVYIGAGIIGSVLTEWTAFQGVVFGGLCAVYANRILERLNEWGLPVPNGIPLINGTMNMMGAPFGKILKKR